MYWKENHQRVFEYDAEIVVSQITDGPGAGVVASSLRLFDNRDKPHQIRLVPSGTSDAAAVLLGVLRMSEYFDPIDTLRIRVWTNLSVGLLEQSEPNLLRTLIAKLGTNTMMFAKIQGVTDQAFERHFLALKAENYRRCQRAFYTPRLPTAA